MGKNNKSRKSLKIVKPRRFIGVEPETYEETKAKVLELLSKLQKGDLPEDEKGVTSLNNQ